MAKEKRTPKNNIEPKLFSKDAENTLYGLILVLVSLIGILNNGFVGNFLTYIVAYLFGVFYFLPFLIAIGCGIYLILKKKGYLLKVNVVFFGVLCIFTASLIGSSLANSTNSFSSVFSNYHNTISNIVVTDTIFKLKINSIGSLGGGIVGQFFATLLISTITDIGAYIVVAIVMIVGLYLTFSNLIVKTFKKIKEAHLKHKERIIARMEQDQKEKEEKEAKKQKQEQERKSLAARANALEVGNDLGTLSNSSSHPKKADPLAKEETIYRSAVIETPTPINQMFADDLEKLNDNKPETKINRVDALNIYDEKSVKGLAKPLNNNNTNYIYPSLDLLEDSQGKSSKALNEKVSEERKETINTCFSDFNIGASVETYTIGPAVTRFDVKVSSNSSVNQVNKVIDDLNNRLGGIYARFAKVVPGKTTSGLEVPNAYVETVTIKEVLYSIKDKKDKPLIMPFGKNISGEVISESMTKFPHMLVAGTSGSGKSVFINAMIISLIMRYTPQELKMVIIDPKRVEFSVYKDMPHLMSPIISDPEEAKVALQKLALEMNNRYVLLENELCTDIKQYNELMKEEGRETLPYIVLIIDEYNDLVMSIQNIEKPIISLAQKARAAGIHICIATQRPTTNVVTGTLKANLATRVALSVANVVDSITILGQSGAENLLGNGDLLLDCPSLVRGGGFIRLQSPYVNPKEIKRVVNFLKENYPVNYNSDFLDLKDHSAMGPTYLGDEDHGSGSNFDNERYQRIKKDVMETREYVSISQIQEAYHANFSTAKSFYAKLQEEGIIEQPGASNSNKGAKVIKRIVNSDNSVDSEDKNG